MWKMRSPPFFCSRRSSFLLSNLPCIEHLQQLRQNLLFLKKKKKKVLQKCSVPRHVMPFIIVSEFYIAKRWEDHFNFAKFKDSFHTLLSTIKESKFSSKNVCFEEILQLNISQNQLTRDWTFRELNELIW